MTLLEELNTLLSPLIQIETGLFSGKAPSCYLTIIPMDDTFELHADNQPGMEVQTARLSLYDKGNYTAIKNRIVRALLRQGITITDRRYIGREDDTGYHHYAIDVAQTYSLDMEE